MAAQPTQNNPWLNMYTGMPPGSTPPTQQAITSTVNQVPGATPPSVPFSNLLNFKLSSEDPITQKLNQELIDNRKAAVEQQQKGLTESEQLLREHLARNRNPQLDLSPLMTLADQWTGSNLTQSYRKPIDSKAAMQTTAELQKDLQKARGALTDDQAQLLQSQLGLGHKNDEVRLQAITAADKLASTYGANADRQYARAEKLSAKQKDEQEKAYSELRDKIESFRGSRPASQAALDAYSASKAMDIVAGRDPNTLTNQDLRLLSSEIAKIATGGVPGEHGVQEMMPENLRTKAAEFQNFLSSNPTPAEAGDYVQRNMAYLQKMKEESDKAVAKYRSSKIQGYKRRIAPEHLQEVYADYPELSPENLKSSAEHTATPTPATPSNSKPAVVIQGGHEYHLNPKTGEYE